MEKVEILARAQSLWPAGLLATSAELAEHGLSRPLLAAAVRQGVVLRLRRGVYLPAEVWQGSGRDQRELFRIQAHRVSARHTGVYSHVSAARLHGLSTWGVPSTVHITGSASQTRSSHAPDTVAHELALAPEEILVLEGPGCHAYRVTSLARTVVDCARTLTLHPAAIIGDQALRRGAAPTALSALLERAAGKPGYRQARTVLDLLDRRSESPR